MKLLLLGGYRFLGRAMIEASQSRGHTVTAFNRGNLTPLPGVEEIRGDRDDPSALAGSHWDAVIDTSGYIPRHVRAAAEALRDTVGAYVFISTLSVYAEPMPVACDESGRRKVLPEGADANGSDLSAETYGARKALCEDTLEAAMPGRNVAVRAGFIIGPHDDTDRFNSWIERAARPRPFLLPGDPDDPLQLIDARDLAAWTIAAAENGLRGPYNVTAPAQPYRALDVACLSSRNGLPRGAGRRRFRCRQARRARAVATYPVLDGAGDVFAHAHERRAITSARSRAHRSPSARRSRPPIPSPSRDSRDRAP